jgi:hypothetical protein
MKNNQRDRNRAWRWRNHGGKILDHDGEYLSRRLNNQVFGFEERNHV